MLLGQDTAQKISAGENQRIHDQIAGLERNIQVLMGASVPNIEERLAQLITADLGKIVQPIVQQTITEGLSTLAITRGPCQGSQSSFQSSQQENAVQSLPGSSSTLEGPKQRVLEIRSRRLIFRKYFSTAFGYFSLQYYMMNRKRSACELHNEDASFEFQCTVIPRFFLRKATTITGTWEPVPKVSLTGLNFQFQPIVDADSEIFLACWEGDIDTMKELFNSKQASPHDRTYDGKDLLIVSICTRALPFMLSIYQEALESPSRYKTCKFLLEAGCQGTGVSGQGMCYCVIFM